MKSDNEITTSQSLGALLKSARDIMRKDKGLSGDLDRLPMLTWIMFLKFLDDLEIQREGEAKLARKKFKPAIEPPYRWRDWATKPDGITGDPLIAFIDNEKCVRPDATEGKGLFPYLSGLTSDNGDDRREVIATVFKGVQNRMISGYLLRDVINKINGIHFTASDELHTLGALYESLLREMRDAAGDSGEFYTPRPVVRFMVTVTDPRLGETVLDPASGTGGFLVESYAHLSQQVKTVAHRNQLQERSLFGCEAKPLPFLLCQMNLLLHGLDAPQIDPLNALRFKLTEIGEKERVDVILTNPPFGGEEEQGIQGNFPEDKQTAETALLFLQLIMRKLRRQNGNARASVIVPDKVLFDGGVTARIREELVKEFNLHTIIRLPVGVFAPYAKTISTNILFFDRTGPTRETWFFEHLIPDGRKTYTKTRPIDFEDFAPCLDWWKKREETEQAWLAKVETIASKGFNLDIKNPHGFEELTHRPPEELVQGIDENMRNAREVLTQLRHSIGEASTLDCDSVPIGEIAFLVKRPWTPGADVIVRSLGVKWWGKGAYISEKKAVEELQADRFLVKADDLIYNDMWARHGSVAVVPSELDGCVASAHFPTWEIDQSRVHLPYLTWCFRSPWFWAACERRSRGSTGRNAIRKGLFRSILLPLPPLKQQEQWSGLFKKHITLVSDLSILQTSIGTEIEALMPSLLDSAFSKVVKNETT